LTDANGLHSSRFGGVRTSFINLSQKSVSIVPASVPDSLLKPVNNPRAEQSISVVEIAEFIHGGFVLRWLLSLQLLALPAAWASPPQVSQQGRILHADGDPVEGLASLEFRLYDAVEDGVLLWEEILEVEVENGYYNVLLGSEDNAISAWFTGESDLFLELTIDGGDSLLPRQPLSTVPYATTSTHRKGGTVNAEEIRVGGEVVVDNAGEWVGPTPEVQFSDVSDVPSGLEDGDDNTQLSESEVDAYVDNNGYALDSDLSALAKSGIWSDLKDVPTGLDDGDDNTQLSESEVEDMITDDAIDLSADSTIDGEALVTEDSNGDVSITQHLDAGGDLSVGGDTKVGGNLAVGGDANLTGDLNATGDVCSGSTCLSDLLPSGVIVMWSGPSSSTPSGWVLCDGSNGTPDLRDRFVVGAGSSYSAGSTGGSSSSSVSVSYGSAAHHSSGLRVVTNVSGGSGLPPYYALAYIMKQ